MANKLQLAIKKRDELQAKVDGAFKRYDAAADTDDTTAVEAEIETGNAELKAAQDEVERLTRLEEMRTASEDATKGITRPGAGGVPQPGAGGFARVGDAEVKSLARSSRVGHLKHLTRIQGFPIEEAELWAYKFARFFLGTVGGMESHAEFTKSLGIEIKAQQEGINTAGGWAVPHEFGTRLIDLREEYGVFRKLCYIEPMKSDTKSVARRLSGVIAYFRGEGQAAIESAMSGDRIGLVAKKIMALVVRSSEVDEDALVNFGDVLAGEIAFGFAQKEDECGFNGDGSGTYGGIVGLRYRLKNLDATRANIAGLVVASGNAWSEIVLGDLSKVKGRLPAYVYRRGAPKWHTSQTFWATVMEPLALAAGGTTAAEVQRGTDKMFLGYPVEITEVYPHAEANDDIPVTFGDIALSSTLGDRRQMTLAVSTDYKFAEDEIAIRGTARFDIVNHDLGNADATPANRVPGPVTGLITAAS